MSKMQNPGIHRIEEVCLGFSLSWITLGPDVAKTVAGVPISVSPCFYFHSTFYYEVKLLPFWS